MSFRESLPYTPADNNYFQQTLNEVITDACGLVQVGIDGENLEPEDYERARVVVNRVILELQTQGIHLATYNTGYLFLQPNQHVYVIEDEKATNTYYERTLSADEATAQTTLSVTSTADIEVADTIGVILDDSTLHWSTVSSFVADTSITIADALPSAAASGNKLFNYRVALKQISRVHQTWRRENYTDDSPVTMIGQQEWSRLPNKTNSTGSASLAYYHRTIPKGTLNLWPVPDSSTVLVGFWYERKMGQMKLPTDIIDLEQYYIPALSYTVALRLCDTFAVSSEVYQRVAMAQDSIMTAALSYDADDTPIQICPNERI